MPKVILKLRVSSLHYYRHSTWYFLIPWGFFPLLSCLEAIFNFSFARTRSMPGDPVTRMAGIGGVCCITTPANTTGCVVSRLTRERLIFNALWLFLMLAFAKTGLSQGGSVVSGKFTNALRRAVSCSDRENIDAWKCVFPWRTASGMLGAVNLHVSTTTGTVVFGIFLAKGLNNA